MSRLILFTFLFLIFYYVLHYFIKSIPSAKKRMDKTSEPEELVQDPYCKTYIPKRSALKKKISGEVLYFCSQECLKNYVQKITKNS